MPADTKPSRRPGCLAALARLSGRLALLLVALAWVVQTTCGERNWVTLLVTYAPPLVFLVAAGIAVALGALSRQQGAAFLGVVAVVLALLTVSRPSFHTHSGPTRTMDTVRVLTWNVHNRFDALPAFEAEVRRVSPDLVCLQEAYDRRFRDLLPGAQSFKRGELVTLSRLKVLHAGPVEPGNPREGIHSPYEIRVALPHGELRLLNIHLYSYQPASWSQPWATDERHRAEEAIAIRTREADFLLDWLARTPGPKVLAGDFNTPPRGRLYGRLASQLADSFNATGNGFGWSFPQQSPLWRIDYVWCSGELKPLDCRTLPTEPSDHRPVVADLQVR